MASTVIKKLNRLFASSTNDEHACVFPNLSPEFVVYLKITSWAYWNKTKLPDQYFYGTVIVLMPCLEPLSPKSHTHTRCACDSLTAAREVLLTAIALWWRIFRNHLTMISSNQYLCKLKLWSYYLVQCRKKLQKIGRKAPYLCYNCFTLFRRIGAAGGEFFESKVCRNLWQHLLRLAWHV